MTTTVLVGRTLILRAIILWEDPQIGELGEDEHIRAGNLQTL